MATQSPAPGSTQWPAGTPGGSPAGTFRQLGPRLGPLGFVVALAVAAAVRDPHESGSWGLCPTYALLGVYCPGCGSLRGLHDLTQGNVVESVGHNALLIPGILFLLFAAVKRPGSRWATIWLVAFVVFTAARNIPGSVLAP